MEFIQFSQVASLLGMVTIFSLLCKILYSWWILPKLTYRKLKANGFEGPTPTFPLGNINDVKKELMKIASATSSSALSSLSSISHNIHSLAFPYFARWQKLHGKVFIYWLGTEPFLYIADPEFIKKMSAGVMGKSWGKPTVFKRDRKAMFGKGLIMVEGDEWVRHRHVITPAFTTANLKGMVSLMADSATHMLDRWAALVNSGNPEIDAESEIISTAGEIIARTSFGISYENGEKVFEKLRSMQVTLFKSTRYVGVPYGNQIMCPKETMKANNLGKEIDLLLMSIIENRKKMNKDVDRAEHDLLSLLLAGNGRTLSTREMVDECKTFFFGGHETTALALTWTLLLLAQHPQWQTQLREEIKQVMNDGEIDPTKLASLRKMGWVMNEVLRLYSPAPNVQRQAREDIKVDDLVIPKGTNMWIDVVSMHHDKQFWGEDVDEFKPERFKDDIHGGCKHKMGYLPFGFGGRMCIGRNLTMMEYKIVLSLILTRFSFSISPNYRHCPSIMLSLRPSKGLPLILQPL
ncbi:cytokinin hydroxylase-like [Lycium ferocissimum]|uniref:cytokinin hydroxylase-like n=1 Tax=Lycium ferocissimum TaxID=112874 RepID=UPI0028166F87|nr:cytokinin hydroxylase-like [Lycium ferocissimum]